MKTKFHYSFIERHLSTIKLEETDKKNFLSLLTYLYSDHTPIANNDAINILQLADKFGVTRLMTLCELAITKDIEKATTNDITNAPIDIVGILFKAQMCNAKQLEKFCLHFLSANYQPMSKRKEFKLLQGKNKEYVEQNQWPPLAYLKEVENYEKTIKPDTKGGEACCIQ